MYGVACTGFSTGCTVGGPLIEVPCGWLPVGFPLHCRGSPVWLGQPWYGPDIGIAGNALGRPWADPASG